MMPEFVQSIINIVKKTTENMHTAVPAVIKSYDPIRGMAVVQPMAKFKKPNGEKVDYPAVTDVPVAFIHSGEVTITFPVKEGDSCLLILSEVALDYWLFGKETDTDLKFDLSSAVAIPNISVAGGVCMEEACAEDAVVICSHETKLKIRADGVHITGDLFVNGTIEASGDVLAGEISLSEHIHSGDSGGLTSPPK